MILLNVSLSTPVFVVIILFTIVVAFVLGCVWAFSGSGTDKVSDFGNPSMRDMEENSYLEDFRKKKETPIIDIDQSITESVRYDWREKTN